jgi:hypothetical protein
MLCALGSLLEPSLVHSITRPFIPASSYLRGIDFVSQVIFNLLNFVFLEVIQSLLLILGYKEVS